MQPLEDSHVLNKQAVLSAWATPLLEIRKINHCYTETTLPGWPVSSSCTGTANIQVKVQAEGTQKLPQVTHKPSNSSLETARDGHVLGLGSFLHWAPGQYLTSPSDAVPVFQTTASLNPCGTDVTEKVTQSSHLLSLPTGHMEIKCFSCHPKASSVL